MHNLLHDRTDKLLPGLILHDPTSPSFPACFDFTTQLLELVLNKYNAINLLVIFNIFIFYIQAFSC